MTTGGTNERNGGAPGASPAGVRFEIGGASVPALSKLFFSHGPGNVPRHMTVAMCFFLFPVVIGALHLANTQGDPGGGMMVLIAACTLIGGAIGGATFHPIKEFRWRGAIAGACAAPFALLACYLYFQWRFDFSGTVWSAEVVFPLALGLAPGGALYYVLMRDQVVTPAELEEFERR
jgi:hypothetical protein